MKLDNGASLLIGAFDVSDGKVHRLRVFLSKVTSSLPFYRGNLDFSELGVKDLSFGLV
jgi:hypothetical protein